ncbi:MAG: peptidoglycan-associated lipoprotein Pal [bacterium]|nr:peptidoglycan-associated lipoprotein Pal [bacterium]
MENRSLRITTVLLLAAGVVFACAHKAIKTATNSEIQAKILPPKVATTPNPASEAAVGPVIKPREITIAELLKKWEIGVGTDGKGIRIKPLNPVHFAFDKSALTDKSRETLEESAAWLKHYPSTKVQVEGHCDEWGTEAYNLVLGERRADSTRKYLLGLGIDSSRITTISYGKDRPVDPEHNRVAWAKNRRDEFVIVSD